MTVQIIPGDCRTVLHQLEDESVHTVITSVPYWGLRDYGTGDHQVGLEATPEEYIATIVAVFREVRRVLRKDGTVWLNIGDCYYSPRYPGGTGVKSTINGKRTQEASQAAARKMKKGSGRGHPARCLLSHGDWTDLSPPFEPHRSTRIEGLKAKDLVMMPALLALALRADGWWLRQDIIWRKPNAMPESVTDRCTKAHEYIFLLSKNGDRPLLWRARDTREWVWTKPNTKETVVINGKVKPRWRGYDYFFDADAIMEPTSEDTHARAARARGRSDDHKWADGGPGNQTIAKVSPSPGRKIKVPSGWDNDSGGHGAYHRNGRAPGVSPKSAPNGSGIRANESWHASTTDVLDMRNKRSVWDIHTAPFPGAHFATFPPALIEPCILAGCPKGGTVLDPFAGAGTTGLVADRLLRNAILIELSAEYCAMADHRLRGDLRDVEGDPAPTTDYGPLFAEAAAQ
jgi:DNA modification methylase